MRIHESPCSESHARTRLAWQRHDRITSTHRHTGYEYLHTYIVLYIPMPPPPPKQTKLTEAGQTRPFFAFPVPGAPTPLAAQIHLAVCSPLLPRPAARLLPDHRQLIDKEHTSTHAQGNRSESGVGSLRGAPLDRSRCLGGKVDAATLWPSYAYLNAAQTPHTLAQMPRPPSATTTTTTS